MSEHELHAREPEMAEEAVNPTRDDHPPESERPAGSALTKCRYAPNCRHFRKATGHTGLPRTVPKKAVWGVSTKYYTK